FTKILIANRGEIACRVMRTCRTLGIKTVAVYSEADALSLHVQMADEAYCIGPAASADSYLQEETLIRIAKATGAQAIHPGYGFLSENAGFAERVAQAGLTFIGPPAQAIVDMGSKSASKEIMLAAGVPCVPGYHGENQDDGYLKAEAVKMGFPVLIKAVKGGGGKGMRIVMAEAEFDEMLGSARRESKKSFGDDRVLVEKYIVRPRHVEVQVFGDQHGDAVYLSERDCSVQRRHQKIIEEAPAPHLTPELRRDLGEKAVAAAKAVHYVGAGTVEFILDTETNVFYFMEMNTRLQVEHPVTEMVTDTDLVQWQLIVAAGNPLPRKQHQLVPRGHAFEARIYAENPDHGFMPDTGPLLHLQTPTEHADLRVETGVRAGDAVSVYYDPMISKLVVRAEDRTAALRVLVDALDRFEVAGVHTNIRFLKQLAQHPQFVQGDVTTKFIEENHAALFPPTPMRPTHVALAALAALAFGGAALRPRGPGGPGRTPAITDPWRHGLGFRIGRPLRHALTLTVGEDDHTVTVTAAVMPQPDGRFDIDVRLDAEDPTLGHGRLTGRVVAVGARDDPQRLHRVHVFTDGVQTTFTAPTPAHVAALAQGAAGGAEGVGSLTAPLHGKVAHIHVKAGETVKKGQPLMVLEAMKMEHLVRSPTAGVVQDVCFAVGDLVGEGQLLVRFVPAEEKKAAS
ncbi:hypothetical protein CXG81DRAFT_9628, partial [Caulochytrium protostelioides]